MQVDQPFAGGSGFDKGDAPLGDRWVADDADQPQLAHGFFGFFDAEFAEALFDEC